MSLHVYMAFLLCLIMFLPTFVNALNVIVISRFNALHNYILHPMALLCRSSKQKQANSTLASERVQGKEFCISPGTAAQNRVSMTEHEAWTSQRGSGQIHINPLPSCAPAHCIPERQAAIHRSSDRIYRINQSTQWGLLLSQGPGHLELWWKQGQISPVHLVHEEGPLWGQIELPVSVWRYDDTRLCISEMRVRWQDEECWLMSAGL